MASTEHLKLSTFIKDVHKRLREDSKSIGPEAAWKKHCEDATTLNQYADSMKELATIHWKQNEDKEKSKAFSRISWIYKQAVGYFREGGLDYQRDREKSISIILNIDGSVYKDFENERQLKLLDVGSCYNPFQQFDEFDVLAIDIAPANDNVKKCDFLNIDIVDGSDINTTVDTVISLKNESFAVVVFSLLLEYLPSAEQRLCCCQNAYDLLIPEGILIIITPDAKHVGANAKYMKSWRFVLAKMGFSRIKYEKLTYLHCMVFRKSVNPAVAQRWAKMNEDKNVYDSINIPQDFNNHKSADDVLHA
ncbi:PREDICTED: probable methyltransferase BTM2 homolog [Nicrophorus vespilloides]|uniref:S-adenosylmethionine sensor upstream of mTORC1 n=1 Tax=Nicrophorus vespilloides TaxID=110193 RepID=A0ABM1MCS0_NICVS|nr:PREDICTED: probable methyltransferase BTM2 homolog [Nicrophorus vespilloides]